MLKDACKKKLWYWEFIATVDGVATFKAPRIIEAFVKRDDKSRFTTDAVSSQAGIRVSTPTLIKGNSYVMTFAYTRGAIAANPIGLAGATQLSNVAHDYSNDNRQMLYSGVVTQWV